MKTQLTFAEITALPEPQRTIETKKYMERTIKPRPANDRTLPCDCGSGKWAGKCCYSL